MDISIIPLLQQFQLNDKIKKQKLNKNEKTVNTNGDIKLYIIMIYVIGMIFTIIQFYFINKKFSNNFILILIIVIGVIFILGLNLYFSIRDPLQNYDTELDLYEYVEQNGRVLLTTSLANAVFINVLIQNQMNSKNLILGIIPSIMAFIYASLILTIVWMPKSDSKYIRLLRDVKTTFLINSIGSMIFTMTYFIILFYN